MDNIKAVAKAYLDMLEARNKKKLDDVDPKELEGSHDDREDGDLDNDGDEDKSDKYLHNRRKTIKKAMNDDDKDNKSGMEESAQEPKSEDLPKKVKLKGFGPDGAQGNMNNPAARSALRVKEGVEIIARNEDGTVDAFIGDELHRGITEEMAKELKHKNVAKAQPEGQEKLEPRAKGEKDFVDQHKVEKKDEEQTVGVDTKGMDGGVKKAPARTGDKTQSEPMKSVQKTTGQ